MCGLGWGVVGHSRVCLLCSPCPHPIPGPSWTAGFDPVLTDALTGPRDSGEEEPRSGSPVPQGPLSVPWDLPTQSPAGPVACDALQLR